MRFLLVNPHYPLTEMPSPPLGLAYIAAALESAGVEVRVLDLVVHTYSTKTLQSLLERFRPQVVGATSVTMTFNSAMKVIKDVKRIDPGIKTVMGGPHISFCAPRMMREHPELDMAVLGEGEETVVELARALDNGGGDLDRIRGMVYRHNGEIRATGERMPGIDVNSLPLPARHLLPLGRYRALGLSISMTTSRGCPFQCIFCVGRNMVGAKVRYRNAESVVDEMQYLGSLGFAQTNLADDLFIVNKKHCHAICDEILARGLRLKWTSFARADTVSVEVLQKMKRAGCVAVSFGFESSNPEILKTVKKGITVEQIVEASRICQRVGLQAQASFILGLPGETPQTMKETVQFCKQLEQLDMSCGFHLLAPFPGTPVRDRSDEYGIKILTDDWSEYHANRGIVETPTVTKEMLDEVAFEFEQGVLEAITEAKDRVHRNRASDEDLELIRKLDRMGVIYDLMTNGVIEDSDQWLPGLGPLSRQEALSAIADRMQGTSIYDKFQIVDALEYAIENGFLKNREYEGRRQLEWVDYL